MKCSGLGVEKTEVALRLARTMTVPEIANALGVHKNSVRHALSANKVSAVPAPADHEAKWWRMKIALVMTGSTRRTNFGYVNLYLPMHPASNVRGEVLEHRVVVERKIGRFLRPDELVHHINEVRDDNRPENLEVMTKQEHQLEHARRRMLAREALEQVAA